MEFYFVMKPRSLVTIPILILASANVLYHSVMFPLMEIDLLIGNPLVFFLLGLSFFGASLGLAAGVAAIPIWWLPSLWEKQGLWGVGKILIYILGYLGAVFGAGLIQAFNFWILGMLATPKTSLWWARLWGFVESV